MASRNSSQNTQSSDGVEISPLRSGYGNHGMLGPHKLDPKDGVEAEGKDGKKTKKCIGPSSAHYLPIHTWPEGRATW